MFASSRRRASHVLAALVACAIVASCANESVVYDALYLSIRSEAPATGAVSRLDIALRRPDGFDGHAGAIIPPPDNPGDYAFPLPAGLDITAKPYRIRLQQAAEDAGRWQLRVLGLDDTGAVLTAFSGIVDTSATEELDVLLKGPDAQCDADGDGIPNCAQAGCCVDGEASDCDDSAASATPFGTEDPCTQCGNGIDEDCDGTDEPCVDSDQDGVADCLEASCPGEPGAVDVYPGAPELCDGKDNDCDGQADEGIAFVGLGAAPDAALGDDCGLGACAGGTVQCDAGGTSLVCSTAGNAAASETCGNGLDDDCNGKADDGCEPDDLDGDGIANDDEASCAHPYAAFHAEVHPGAPEPCCVEAIGASDLSAPALLEACDRNCDGVVVACDAADQDGDGVAAPLDCDDNDPLTYPDAPERCGDGKVQGCFGADPACAGFGDGDGDGWAPPADCDDGDVAVFPGATETCNGVDDNCDGIVDDGNPGTAGKSPAGDDVIADATCGDPDGECGKQAGTAVCKHYAGDDVPEALDCFDDAPFDAASGVCVGCFGDNRPQDETCNGLDDDCDATPDEDFTYTDEAAATLAVGAGCDGVGACAEGTVECNPAGTAAVCSTDPNGSAPTDSPETCNNSDDDCDGTTDEDLTAVSDSTCEVVGVCAGGSAAGVKTICKAGVWVCDYGAVANIEFAAAPQSGGADSCAPGDAFCHCPGLGDACHKLVEASCDGLDNDCDGAKDDDFAFDDLGVAKPLGATCGTGACKDGSVICNAAGDGLTCDSLGLTSAEMCNKLDDDCNGATDDGMTVADSDCKLLGPCTTSSVAASCVDGLWQCTYDSVAGYEGDAEASCDGVDNDCDGNVDEDFSYAGVAGATKVGDGCGVGLCIGGLTVCNAAKDGLTCDSLGNAIAETCNSTDDDCDGSTDEDFTYTEAASGKVVPVGLNCDGVGACGLGVVECLADGLQAACSTDLNGSSPGDSAELCNDIDDDCDGETDEGCDDDNDDYCDAAMTVVGSPATCSKSNGDQDLDCDDTPETGADINPGTAETCNSVDDDCDASTDEDFVFAQTNSATGQTSPIAIGAACGLGVCAGGKVQCGGPGAAECTTFPSGASLEVCDGKDNDCDGQVDEGCDDDQDGYCDAAMDVINTVACPNTSIDGGKGDDCDDDAQTGASVNPAATEVCNDIDDDCEGGVDEGCDDDKDDYCDGEMTVVGSPAVCPKTLDAATLDCDDALPDVNPGETEACNGLDDDCTAGIDNGCDDDKDDYCDAGLAFALQGGQPPAVCPNSTNNSLLDCNDDVAAANPAGAEICNDLDDDCDSNTDEGCDNDGDDYCDAQIATVGSPAVCPNGAMDCNDNDASVFPGQTESCNNLDDNCGGGTDEGCDDDGDKFCDANLTVTNTTVCPKSTIIGGKGDDCDDAASTVNPDQTEVCNGIDDDCKAGIDDGCDDDNDDFCDAAMTTKGTPAVCPNGGGDCDDGVASTFPGAAEACNDIDDSCGDGTDEGCDDDKDDYCDGNLVLVGTPAVCPLTTGPATTDCDDEEKKINPGATDTCATAGVDDNCDGTTDAENAAQCDVYYLDADGDTWGVNKGKCICGPDPATKFTVQGPVPGGVFDCDDGDPAVNPGVSVDTCATSGVDDDCDGTTDGADADGCSNFYYDGDGDTWPIDDKLCLCAAGDVAKYTSAAPPPASFDCADDDQAVHPGVADDSCATADVDDDCDGTTDDGTQVTLPPASGCAPYYEDSNGDDIGEGDPVCLCAYNVASLPDAWTLTAPDG